MGVQSQFLSLSDLFHRLEESVFLSVELGLDLIALLADLLCSGSFRFFQPGFRSADRFNRFFKLLFCALHLLSRFIDLSMVLVYDIFGKAVVVRLVHIDGTARAGNRIAGFAVYLHFLSAMLLTLPGVVSHAGEHLTLSSRWIVYVHHLSQLDDGMLLGLARSPVKGITGGTEGIVAYGAEENGFFLSTLFADYGSKLLVCVWTVGDGGSRAGDRILQLEVLYEVLERVVGFETRDALGWQFHWSCRVIA